MKKFIIGLVCVALLIILGFLLWSHFHGSSSDTAYTMTVQLSGTPGAAFIGEYVCDGRHVPISGVLPWSLTESNISRLEIRKARTEDTVTLAAHGGGSSLSAPSGPDSKGIRLETAGGWNVQIIR